MDFDFMLKYTPNFINAALLTLEVFALGLFFSLCIGIFCVLMQYFKLKLLSQICRVYIELSRNTPLLIQLFFLYYGLGRLGLGLESFSCAVLGLSFLGGSYMAESLRAGIEAVKKQQFEAALSLALSPWQVFRFVILPQALSVAMPSLSANTIFLFKETSVVTIIALPDLVYTMTSLNSLTYKTDELLFMLFVSYLCIILPLSLFLSYLEKRLRYA
ncbi:polar amino acid ABC transporter permease [Campylobacter sp. MIT 12-5580]|uniref:amino acid ABC transporter permease n=1 Tax=Campylobacter sp. MIT 12-5580 TaxID=2040651 RepID=UPI0010F49F6A|nr:amino acid ABC transporter permease [Campylobacter sp. MIT 12-5580]TKX28626.1 polar amino acid ABC transporter permease [Campylobacter sp. MIT 12-5580]